jgi:ribose-phosphate pyrophosphokinase
MKVLAGNSNRRLAGEIAQYLDIELTEASVRRFSDGEIFVEIKENVRGEDVFIVQSTSNPANDNLMELLICIDALRRSSARRITAVIPYFGYARQDRKPGPRTPISSKLVANLITEAGADRVLTMDLHAGQIQGFFDIPTDNLYALPVMIKDIEAKFGDSELMFVSPDVGGVARTRAYAKRVHDSPIAIIDKRREKANESEVMNIVGEVKGKNCVIVDDMCDTAGTLCNAADALMAAGAKSVTSYISHGVLSGPAVDRIDKSSMSELICTDSIQPTEVTLGSSKIRYLGIAPLIGEAMRRISQETSVSSLFI